MSGLLETVLKTIWSRQFPGRSMFVSGDTGVFERASTTSLPARITPAEPNDKNQNCSMVRVK